MVLLRETAGSEMNGHKKEFYGKKLCEKPLARSRVSFAAGQRQSVREQGLGMHLNPASRTRNQSGFTLVESMMSVVIITMFFATVVIGYTRGSEYAQWSGYSLAAQAQSTMQLEEFRSVLWDTQSTPITDNTTNVPTNLVMMLDLPITGTNVVYATNTATVTGITNGTTIFKMIVINTTWTLPLTGKHFTNTIVAYRAPNQ